jgi:RNA polymerase I-specific transcription initiation factor RRN6
MYYKGTVALTPGVLAILSGSPDAKSTEFGDSFVTFGFETGSEKYKELQNGTYVGAGRFVNEGGQTVVEYKVSRVVV